MNGFVTVDSDGEFVSWAASVEVATMRLRELPRAARVERCSDGALIAYTPRRRAHGAAS